MISRTWPSMRGKQSKPRESNGRRCALRCSRRWPHSRRRPARMKSLKRCRVRKGAACWPIRYIASSIYSPQKMWQRGWRVKTRFSSMRTHCTGMTAFFSSVIRAAQRSMSITTQQLNMFARSLQPQDSGLVARSLSCTGAVARANSVSLRRCPTFPCDASTHQSPHEVRVI